MSKPDIVERLRKTVTQDIGWMGEQELSVADLQLDAAREIERLRSGLRVLLDYPDDYVSDLAQAALKAAE